MQLRTKQLDEPTFAGVPEPQEDPGVGADAKSEEGEAPVVATGEAAVQSAATKAPTSRRGGRSKKRPPSEEHDPPPPMVEPADTASVAPLGAVDVEAPVPVTKGGKRRGGRQSEPAVVATQERETTPAVASDAGQHQPVASVGGMDRKRSRRDADSMPPLRAVDAEAPVGHTKVAAGHTEVAVGGKTVPAGDTDVVETTACVADAEPRAAVEDDHVVDVRIVAVSPPTAPSVPSSPQVPPATPSPSSGTERETGSTPRDVASPARMDEPSMDTEQTTSQTVPGDRASREPTPTLPDEVEEKTMSNPHPPPCPVTDEAPVANPEAASAMDPCQEDIASVPVVVKLEHGVGPSEEQRKTPPQKVPCPTIRSGWKDEPLPSYWRHDWRRAGGTILGGKGHAPTENVRDAVTRMQTTELFLSVVRCTNDESVEDLKDLRAKPVPKP